MPTVELNGIHVRYDAMGEGAPVLLTHGYSATGRMWTTQQRRLADRYRVVSWDMRGHGFTECGQDQAAFSMERTVADMHALLRHLGADRAVVGGLSLGGTMSLAFYLAHPEMVRALVIADSGPGFRNADARAAWNRQAMERAADLETRGLDALAGRSREMREAMGEHRSAKALALAARGMLTQHDSRIIDGLPSIRVPTIVIVGDRDEPFLASCRYMASKIPGARLEIIKDAGHSANLDQPDAFTGVLREFLDSLP